MPKFRTFSTLFASVLLGALTFFLSSPKKVIKKREQNATQSEGSELKEDLFI